MIESIVKVTGRLLMFDNNGI